MVGIYPSPTRYPGIKDLQTSFAKPLMKRDFGEKAISDVRPRFAANRFKISETAAVRNKIFDGKAVSC
jgi:hypothetical protein